MRGIRLAVALVAMVVTGCGGGSDGEAAGGDAAADILDEYADCLEERVEEEPFTCDEMLARIDPPTRFDYDQKLEEELEGAMVAMMAIALTGADDVAEGLGTIIAATAEFARSYEPPADLPAWSGTGSRTRQALDFFAQCVEERVEGILARTPEGEDAPRTSPTGKCMTITNQLGAETKSAFIDRLNATWGDEIREGFENGIPDQRALHRRYARMVKRLVTEYE